MKNGSRKLEVPLPAALPCKTQSDKYRETCSVERKCKTKYACIVEADESTRKRMEESLHKYHEDHIAGKGINSLNSKTYQSPTVPQRIVLQQNLNYERQDTTSSDARTSFDHSDKHGGTYRETCRVEKRLQDPRIARSHPQTGSPEIESPVPELPEQRSTTSRPKTKSRVQSVQRAVEGNDLQHGEHGVFGDLRDHSQHAMLQLYDMLPKGIVY